MTGGSPISVNPSFSSGANTAVDTNAKASFYSPFAVGTGASAATGGEGGGGAFNYTPILVTGIAALGLIGAAIIFSGGRRRRR